MVEGRELHSAFRIRAFCRTEQALQEHVGKRRQRHHPVRITEPRRASRQAGCILRGFPNFSGGRSRSAVGFLGSRQGEPCLKSPLGSCARLRRQLPCPVNHADNGTHALLQFIIFSSHLLHFTDPYGQLSPQLDYLY